MTTNNKTLADVQPGGRVRLGDRLPPIREDEPLRGDEPAAEQHDARMFNRGWNACREAVAALSAQPSPGGQGADLAPRIRGLAMLVEVARPHEAIQLRDIADELAARQPVGAATVKDSLTVAGRQPVVVDLPESLHTRVETLRELAARQPVGEPVVISKDARECLQEIIDNCWRDEDQAVASEIDRLMRGPIYAAPPAQAVDMGQIIEQIAEQWDGCSYDAVGGTIDIGGAIRSAGKRLIDSQAVGK